MMVGQELISDRKLVEEKEYWIQRLDGLEQSGIRPDFERPEHYAGERSSDAIEIPDDLTQKLFKMAGNSDFLIYTTLLATWIICINKYTEYKRIVVGSPALIDPACKDQQSNVLAILGDIHETISFRELLLQVRESLLAAYARQQYPFKRLVKDIGLADTINRSVLFDTLMEFENIHLPLPDLKSDIVLRFKNAAGQIKGSLDYNSNLFGKERISRLRDHFKNILRLGLEDSTSKVREMNMLLPAERDFLLVQFNATGVEYSTGRRVHELFESQAEASPEAIALAAGQEHLTYQALNERANKLAHYLTRFGVGPEVLVGVFVERSINMVTALLAILKAGGAYVPLDASSPKKRLRYILQESAIGVVLTEREMAGQLPEGEFEVICIKERWEEISRYGENNLDSRVEADNLAYVIYTSGSTGKPKGVMIPHRGVVNYLNWCKKAYKVEEGEGSVVHTSLGFDLTVTSLFSPIVAGKKCVLVNEQDGIDGLSEELKRAGGYSLLKLTPAHLEVLKHRMGEQRARGRANALVIGGEALKGESLRYWREQSAQTRLINEYGPTETVVGCIVYEVGEAEELSGPVAIGKPIANTQIYVLAETMEPMAEGLIGEIYVGGEGLGRGYIADPLRTAERYVPNPFEGEGQRLYRTGDRARHRWDGNLEYHGRSDEQVKIRGYRIEIQEVEAALSEEEVEDVAVVVNEQEGEEKKLIAYLVKKQDVDIDSHEMKRRLSEKLPAYMMPALIVELTEMPLTTNGKINRRALASRKVVNSAAGTHLTHASPVEEVVAGIWASLLKLEGVGAHDNFFDSGGHSLLATQLLSRVRKIFNVEVALRSFYATPTVAGLASKIEEEVYSEKTLTAIPIERIPRDGNLPLSFAQQRLWFLDHLKPGTSGYNVPVAVRLEGKLNLRALEQTLCEIIRRHESLRATFQTVRGQPVQVILAQPLPLHIVDLSSLADRHRDAEANHVISQEAREPFNLAQGPLLRFLLVRLDADHHIAQFTMHHIITDGWSMGVLIREVTALYEAFSQDNPSPLADLAIQYADFAHWQRQMLTDEVLERHIAYWRGQLEGSVPVLELPTDRPRKNIRSSCGSVEWFTIPKDLLKETKDLSRQEGVTLFMTLASAYQVLIYSYTEQTDFFIGTDIANRNRIEIEELIGFFVNQLPLRLKISGDPSFKDLMAQVRDVTLAAYAHQDLPFEKLVDGLKLKRSTMYSPLFQVKIVLQNLPIDRLDLSGLTLTPIEVDSGAAKFDLALIMWENSADLSCAFEYNTDLFDQATIIRMAMRYKSILSSVVKRKDICVSELKQMLIESETWQQASEEPTLVVSGSKELKKNNALSGEFLRELF